MFSSIPGLSTLLTPRPGHTQNCALRTGSECKPARGIELYLAAGRGHQAPCSHADHERDTLLKQTAPRATYQHIAAPTH